MPITTEIKYSQLENRFDSEYYKPEYMEIEKILSKFDNVEFFGNIVHSFTNGVEIREFVKEGIPYLRVSDTNREFMVALSEVVFVRESDAEKIKKKIELSFGDILINRSGTLGISQIVTEDIKGCIISSHIIRLTEISSEINHYFLVTFLNCKFGRLQILRNNNGGVVPEINQPSLKSILVPIPHQPFQLHIEKLVKEAFSKRKIADEKYEQAKQVLEKELGLDKLKIKEEKIFEAKSSELFESMRFDAEYYKPKYKQIIEFLKNSEFEIKKLKEVVKISNKKIDPTKEPSKKIKYVEIGDIDIFTGEISIKEIYGRDAPSNAKKILKEGDVIISLVRPTRGAITIIPGELDNSIATSALVVCKTEEPFREYLSVFLKSSLGLGQLEKPISSSMYPTIKINDVKNILIPIIPKQKQENIAKLIKQSFTLRKEAKQLLEEAKEKVEKMIF